MISRLAGRAKLAHCRKDYAYCYIEDRAPVASDPSSPCQVLIAQILRGASFPRSNLSMQEWLESRLGISNGGQIYVGNWRIVYPIADRTI